MARVQGTKGLARWGGVWGVLALFGLAAGRIGPLLVYVGQIHAIFFSAGVYRGRR